MFTDIRSGARKGEVQAPVPSESYFQKKVFDGHCTSKRFGVVKRLLALATAAAIGTTIAPTLVYQTVTTRLTRMLIATTITASVASRLPPIPAKSLKDVKCRSGLKRDEEINRPIFSDYFQGKPLSGRVYGGTRAKI